MTPAAATHDPLGARTLLKRGLAWQSACNLARALDDFDGALRLDPGLTEARFLRAQLLENRDAAAALDEYATLVGHDPDNADVLMRRAGLRRAMGDSIGALADYRTVEVLSEHAISARHWRTSVARERALLYETMGYHHGASADYDFLAHHALGASTGARGNEDSRNMLRNRGRLHWKAGRFDVATNAFSTLVDEAGKRGKAAEPIQIVWRFLALARLDPKRAGDYLLAAWPGPGRRFAIRTSRTGLSPAWEPSGPPCPTCKWPEPVLELYCGRLTPAEYIAMAEPALAISDQWKPPQPGRGVSLAQFLPPAQHLWRAEVAFYLGQYHLLFGHPGSATQYLEIAAADARARTFECYAAGAELARKATAM